MISGALKIIGEEVLKKITKSSLKKIKPALYKMEKDDFEKIKNSFPELYENHFNEICNWAYSIPFIGLSKPKHTEISTVELLIASDIIRLNSEDEISKISDAEI